MHSPLPDASALEAGILEDTQPSRLSRVQDSVRLLLRNAIPPSVRSSPRLSPSQMGNGLPTPPVSPLRAIRIDGGQHPNVISDHLWQDSERMVPQGPNSSSAQPWTTTQEYRDEPELNDGPLPSGHVEEQARANQHSVLFNSRALAALDHPDLSDPSLAILSQQKTEARHRRKHRGLAVRRRRRPATTLEASQRLLCVLSALLLAAIVATYATLADETDNISPTFHILFVFAILLAAIVFAHSTIGLCVLRESKSSERVVQFTESRPRRHEHRSHHRTPSRTVRSDPQLQPNNAPSSSTEREEFSPTTPIRVQMGGDEDQVRLDSREAKPSAAVHQPSVVWERGGSSTVPRPPPAYGRWRDSVRANPELLHWQAIPSPVDPDAPALPSPLYEEAVANAQHTGPPSYMTRESPARPRGKDTSVLQQIGGQVAEQHSGQEAAQMQPEMFEVGEGVGLM